MDDIKRSSRRTSQKTPHYYRLEGVGIYENMKDLRSFLGISRQAIRLLMRAGVVKKILKTPSQELSKLNNYVKEDRT